MNAIANFVDAIAWPGIVGGTLWLLRTQLMSLIDAAVRQFSLGAKLKWKDFEFSGVSLRKFPLVGGQGYQRDGADRELLAAREEKYRELKNLFLVHEVRPTGQRHEVAGLPIYDVQVKLVPHKHYGHLNDVQRVEYYLGKHFGRDKGAFGSKYLVEDGSNGFAVIVDAYGPTLCECTIFFHDGSVGTCSRYLDFLGTDYLYEPEKVADADKQTR